MAQHPTILDYAPPAKKRVSFLLRTVLPICVIVAVLIIVSYPIERGGSSAPKRLQKTKMLLSNVKQALETLKADTSRYPTTAEGLDALVHAPPGMPGWDGQYIDKYPVDGWGDPILYAFPSPTDPSTYDLHSVGPDGQDGTDDDITKNDL